ncbi:Aha1 domain-containing protein [Arabidopsis thaliana]|uniref:Aha1 domain-containing protein n=1 Tax=Arabidopsis thaliana TaxID=3702 RepID=F4J8L7_ARATH|nr:Aha1 domain-containing protein [Arabidopsis thaliana]AEE75142.1 Aha1 domain-containing protein [Arabidopsis thaliana]|eukprot:NP_850566.1 Aha1 domain-containing protein [Arabidopsis thaliana]
MAKFGEGDKRWIVEDRPDGTNVHNWHWSETNCLEWSRNFFTKQFSGVDILSGEGEAKDSDGKTLLKADGLVDMPYISDENADEDPEIRFSVKDEGPIGRTLKEAMVKKGKEIILEKVRVYVEAMARGGPCRDELESKKVAPKSVAAGSATVAVEKSGAAPVVSAAAVESKVVKEKKKAKTKEGFKTITMTEKFNCRARDLYEILMDENRWKGFTQSNAKISKDVNGPISVFDGSVTGMNLELEEGKLIVQKWRFGSWPDGLDSTVKIVFEEPQPGVTIVNLTHTDVPEEDRYGNATVVENTERGWRDLIFHRIRAVFGFGI